MKQLKKEEMYLIKPLFSGCDDTLVWTCLEGNMGNAWVDNVDNPKSAQIITADFCFFVGEPNIDLIKNIPECYTLDYMLIIPQNNEWATLIEENYKENCDKFFRYAIKKEGNIFDVEKLSTYVNELPDDYTLVKVDEKLYNQLSLEEWSEDLCSQFKDYNSYKNHGLGYVVFHNGEIVSGASSYIYYNDGIEIEIDTKRDYRRKGLATVCGAKLILDCLENNLYPSWDAANKESVALSEKLGYHFDKQYVTYEITDFR